MEEYKIYIEPDLSDDYSIITQEYWEVNNGEFINKPKLLCTKYNITIGELNKIIRDCSYCNIVYGFCSDFGVAIEKKIYSQTSFKESKKRLRKDRCSDCETIYYKEREELRQIQITVEKEKIKERFTKAIQNRRWTELTAEEIEILKSIMRLKCKSSIYREMFGGDPFDKSVWRKIENIEKKDLLFVERSNFQRVIGFEFPVDLKIQPLENIVQKIEQGEIEREPIQIKDILNNFFNQIDSKEFGEK